jgi:hypothetical protein
MADADDERKLTTEQRVELEGTTTQNAMTGVSDRLWTLEAL